MQELDNVKAEHASAFTKRCCTCKELKPFEAFSKCQKTKDGLDFRCTECKRVWRLTNKTKWQESYRKAGKKWRDSLKQEFVNAYGGKCTCCGETEIGFLTVEHLNRDGQIHRLQVNGSWGVLLDLKRRNWPKDAYTVLCYNCNMAKRFGECPHKTNCSN